MLTFDLPQHLAHVAVVARETARMAQDFRNWPEAYWQRPTYCPGWLAQDAVAHLATGGDFYAQVIAAGRGGKPQLPWGASDAAGARTARAAAVEKLIAAGPAAVAAGFEQGAAKLHEVLAALTQEDLAKVAWHPRGLVPIGGWTGMRLNELVVHDWDMRQPHEANAKLAPTALSAMLTVLPEFQRKFLEQRATDGLDGVYVLRAGTATWAFTIQGRTVIYQARPPAAFDAYVSAEADSLILLTMGRADATAKRHRGALTLSGNIEKAERLCATLFRPL
jgi:uncharacterized protein (TIGR03083 family)